MDIKPGNFDIVIVDAENSINYSVLDIYIYSRLYINAWLLVVSWQVIGCITLIYVINYSRLNCWQVTHINNPIHNGIL